MNLRVFSTCALALCVALLSATVAHGKAWQEPAKQADVKVSDGERTAAEKINKAADVNAKFDAAVEFLKKFPKSGLRPRIGEALAAAVASVQDPAQKIAAGEKYLGIFKEPGEADRVNAPLLEGYIVSGRAEDAFRLGEVWLVKNPDDVDVMRRLAIVGANEAIKGNNKFVEQGNKYGAKALELVENDKKPASVEAAQWADYKKKWMPSMYREAGILALRSGDRKAAQARLEKAAELKTPDAAIYAIIGQMHDEDYAALAEKYKALPAGAEKTAMLEKVHALMDKAIEYYARSIAVAGDKPEFEQLRTQVRPGLEEYYKFRHAGSTDGLQQLIDKYKAAQATP